MKTIEYLQGLRDAVATNLNEHSRAGDDILLVLENHASDLQSAFRESPLSTTSRQKVQSGKVVLDEMECEINKPFIDECLQVADVVKADELECASLLNEATELGPRYDREPFSCSIYLYYTRRAILLDTFRLVLEFYHDDSSDLLVKETLRSTINTVMSASAFSFASTCIKLMKACRETLAATDAMQAKKNLIGDRFPDEDILFIRCALIQEHQAFALILSGLIYIYPDCGDFLPTILQELKTETAWSDLVSHRVLVVMRNVQCYRMTETSILASHLQSIEAQFSTMISLLFSDKETWACVPLKSVLEIALAAELNGLCKTFEQLSSAFKYDSQIRASVRDAASSGAFQHLVTFSLFCSMSVMLENPYSMYLRKDAYVHYQVRTEDVDVVVFSDTVLDILLRFSVSFIANFADELKEMRLQQEDMLLTAEMGEETISNDRFASLELFMALIYTVFKNGTADAGVFWDDSESDLFGFLAWASHAQTPSLIYSFSYMISALIKTELDASHVIAFLDSDDNTNVPAHLRPAQQSTWSFLFDAFRYYARCLDRSPAVTNFKEPLEIDAQNALILQAYLELISTTVLLAPAELKGGICKRHDCLTVYFTLINCRLPAELYSALFRALAAFASQAELQISIWQMLEQWLAGVDITRPGYTLGQSVTKRQQLVHRPSTALDAFVDKQSIVAHALIDLMASLLNTNQPGSLPFPEALGQNTRHAGIVDYIDFVMDNLLALQQESTLSAPAKISAILSCLLFMQRALMTFDLQLIDLARAGVKDIDNSIPATNLPLYITLHPGARVLQRLSQTNVRQLLCGIIRSRNLGDASLRKHFQGCVEATFYVLRLALKHESHFEEFILPRLQALSHLDKAPLQEVLSEDSGLIVQTVLVASSQESSSATANQLLHALLQGNSENLTTRLLTAVTSVDQSKEFLHGYIEKFSSTPPSEHLNDILRMLLAEVTDCTAVTIGLFLLGFRVLSKNQIDRGDDSGEIGSKVSLFHTLLGRLNTYRDEDLPEPDSLRCEECSLITRIVAQLVSLPFSSSIILEELRELDCVETLLYTPKMPSFSSIYDSETELTHCVIASTKQKSSILLLLARDLLAIHAEGAETRLQNSLERLTIDNQNFVLSPLLQYLDVLELDLQSKSPDHTWNIFELSQYDRLMINGVNLENIKLALQLRVMQMPPGEEAAAVELRNVAETERAFLVEHYTRLFDVNEARNALFEFLSNLRVLMTLVLDFAKKLEIKIGFSGEVLSRLLQHLERFQESEPEITDVLAECISSVMSRSALEVRLQEVHARAFKTALIITQSPSSTPGQREHMYLVCIDYLNALFKHRDTANLNNALKDARSGNERLLKIVVQDATLSQGLQKLAASMFLDILARSCLELNQHWFFLTLQKTNMITQLFEHFINSIRKGDDIDAEAQLDVLLRLCMNRECGRDMQRTQILQTLVQWSALDLDKGDKNLKSVVQVLELMTCLLIKPGSSSEVVKNAYSGWKGMLSRYLDSHWLKLKDRKRAADGVADLVVAVELMNGLTT